MAFNIKARGASETGTIELKAGDGSPLNDDAGNVLSVTVHSPASKQWEAAQAAMNRKRAERLRKNGGKLEAALDNAKAHHAVDCEQAFCSANGGILVYGRAQEPRSRRIVEHGAPDLHRHDGIG